MQRFAIEAQRGARRLPGLVAVGGDIDVAAHGELVGPRRMPGARRLVAIGIENLADPVDRVKAGADWRRAAPPCGRIRC